MLEVKIDSLPSETGGAAPIERYRIRSNHSHCPENCLIRFWKSFLVSNVRGFAVKRPQLRRIPYPTQLRLSTKEQ
jgi:hypothetical protein